MYPFSRNRFFLAIFSHQYKEHLHLFLQPHSPSFGYTVIYLTCWWLLWVFQSVAIRNNMYLWNKSLSRNAESEHTCICKVGRNDETAVWGGCADLGSRVTEGHPLPPRPRPLCHRRKCASGCVSLCLSRGWGWCLLVCWGSDGSCSLRRPPCKAGVERWPRFHKNSARRSSSLYTEEDARKC